MFHGHSCQVLTSGQDLQAQSSHFIFFSCTTGTVIIFYLFMIYRRHSRHILTYHHVPQAKPVHLTSGFIPQAQLPHFKAENHSTRCEAGQSFYSELSPFQVNSNLGQNFKQPSSSQSSKLFKTIYQYHAYHLLN